MRRTAIALVTALAGCAPAEQSRVGFVSPSQPYGSTSPETLERIRAELSARGMGEEGARTPEQRARFAREASLLEDALSGRPDYRDALRRAAIANIADQPTPARERPAQREARIEAEVARLSDAIEKRRRERLAQRDQQNQSARDQAAVAACQARGQAIDAAMYDRRSILNLDGAVAGAQAREACLDAYRRTGVLP